MKKICKYCLNEKEDIEFEKELSNRSVCKKCFNDIKNNENIKQLKYKICEECFYKLPIFNFNISNKTEDGYSNTCKVCMKNKNEFNRSIANIHNLLKCKTCNIEKTVNEFYRKAANPFTEACKMCVEEITLYENRKQTNKKCSICKEEKIACNSNFNIDVSKGGYLGNICKECESKRTNKRKNIRKEMK